MVGYHEISYAAQEFRIFVKWVMGKLGRLDVRHFSSDLKIRTDWIVFPIGLFGSS